MNVIQKFKARLFDARCAKLLMYRAVSALKLSIRCIMGKLSIRCIMGMHPLSIKDLQSDNSNNILVKEHINVCILIDGKHRMYVNM